MPKTPHLNPNIWQHEGSYLACRALVQAQRERLRGGPARAQPAAQHPRAVGLRRLQAGLRAAQVVQQRGRRVARLQGTSALLGCIHTERSRTFQPCVLAGYAFWRWSGTHLMGSVLETLTAHKTYESGGLDVRNSALSKARMLGSSVSDAAVNTPAHFSAKRHGTRGNCRHSRMQATRRQAGRTAQCSAASCSSAAQGPRSATRFSSSSAAVQPSLQCKG